MPDSKVDPKVRKELDSLAMKDPHAYMLKMHELGMADQLTPNEKLSGIAGGFMKKLRGEEEAEKPKRTPAGY